MHVLVRPISLVRIRTLLHAGAGRYLLRLAVEITGKVSY
jgi:hypothetical protein